MRHDRTHHIRDILKQTREMRTMGLPIGSRNKDAGYKPGTILREKRVEGGGTNSEV
jgi:hypothetical protein